MQGTDNQPFADYSQSADAVRSLSLHDIAAQPHASVENEDFLHEILAMNTLAMQRCNAELLEEAGTILSEAYMKLHNYNENDGDPRMLDTLRSTTMNNLGVVECHRGQHRQALSYFEAARQLEEKWGTASPSVALNTCAAYNALRMFDKATAAALETIDMLRLLAAREKTTAKAKQAAPTRTHSHAEGESLEAKEPSPLSLLPAQTSSGVNIAKSDNRALWGAAWHNLAVAQINTARTSSQASEHTNAAALFQNAMRSTQELLGRDHPMTRSVTQTYRAVRDALRSRGAYRQHHYLRTAPPRPVDPRDEEEEQEAFVRRSGITRRRAMERFHRELTITFRGEVTNGATLTERLDATPYPGAQEVIFRSAEGSRKSRTPHVLRCMALGGTLLRAGQLYGNPHPLLTSMPANYEPLQQLDSSGRRQRSPTPTRNTFTSSKPRVIKQQKKQEHQQNQQQQSHYPQRPNQQQQSQYPQQQIQQQQSPQRQSQYQQQSHYPQQQSQQQQSPQRQSQYQQQKHLQQQQGQARNSSVNDPHSSPATRSFLPHLKKSQRSYSGNAPGAPREDVQPEGIQDQHVLKPQRPKQNSTKQSFSRQQPREQQREKSLSRQSLSSPRRQSAEPMYEQVKYILLAEPFPAGASQVLDNSSAAGRKSPYPISSDSKDPKSHEPPQTVLQQKVQNSGGSVGRWEQDVPAEAPQYVGSGTRLSGGGSADWSPTVEDTQEKEHHFFDAMWVATTDSTGGSTPENRATRVVGRPNYFVSSAVNVASGDKLLSGQVVQMMLDSSSSSVDKNIPQTTEVGY